MSKKAANPWANITPGGVAFTRPLEDDEDDTPYANPGTATRQKEVLDEETTQESAQTQEVAAETVEEVGSSPATAGLPVAPGGGLPLQRPGTPSPASSAGHGLPVAPVLPATRPIQQEQAPAPVLPVTPPGVSSPQEPVTHPAPGKATTQEVTHPEQGEVTPAPAQEGAQVPAPSYQEEVTSSPAKEAPVEVMEEVAPVREVPVPPAQVLPTRPVVPTPAPVTVEATPAQEVTTHERVRIDPSLPAPRVPVTQAEPPQEGEVVRLADGSTVNTATGEVLTPSTPQAPQAPVVPTPVAVPADVPAVVPVVVPVVPVGQEWEDTETEEVLLAPAKEKKEKTKRRTSKQRDVALTERDKAFLAFLARYKYATYPQVAGAFGTTPVALRQRFPRLAKEGLLVHKVVGQSQFGVWVPTETGIRVSGLDLPTPTVSWATVTHTLGLVDIGVAYELAGETVVTEREVRAADTRDRPSPRMRAAMKYAGYDPDLIDDEDNLRLYSIPLGANETAYGHIPDMVLVRPNHPNGAPGSVAIELELNHKPASQWRKILRAYKESSQFGSVIYFTNQSKIANGVKKAAAEVGASDVLKVYRFTPTNGAVIPTPAN